MARTSDQDRARRLITLLSRFRRDSHIALSELAQEMDVSEERLTDDLEMLSMCGVAPYDPGQLVPIYVDEGSVHVWGTMPALDRAIRLSLDESRALTAALQAAGLSDDEPLVARLREAASSSLVPGEIESTIRAGMSSHDGDVYRALAHAIGEHHVVTVSYLTACSSAPSSRDVEPHALFAERGAWYLSAWCRRAAAWRVFRLDRIKDASVGSESFDPKAHGDEPDTQSALPSSGLDVAHLAFAPGEVFVERDWPGASVIETRTDGSVMIGVPLASEEWLARRVVARLGAVEALAPQSLQAAVARRAEAERDTLRRSRTRNES